MKTLFLCAYFSTCFLLSSLAFATPGFQGLFSIKTVDNKCLQFQMEAHEDRWYSGEVIQAPCTHAANQKFILQTQGDGTIAILSHNRARALDMSIVPNSPVYHVSEYGSSIDILLVDNNTYVFRKRYYETSPQCLDIEYRGNRTRMISFPCTYTETQLFKIEPENP